MKSKAVLMAVALSACFVAGGPATAGETIATTSWEYEAPEGWTMDRSARPARSVGPDQELVQFSSQGVPSVSDGEQGLEIRKKVEGIALQAMQEGATQEGLRVVAPLQTTELAPELRMHEIASESTDGTSVLVQFALIGPHAVLLITYEARTPGTSLKAVRRSIMTMKWAA